MLNINLHPNTQSALRIVFATLLLAGGIVSLLYLGQSDQPTYRIAFASHDGNDFEIFTVNPDGTDLIQITDNVYDDWGATWSPNREQLAFRSTRNGIPAIYVMDSDGTNIEQISDPKLYVGNPYYQATMSWSPDGSQIVYSANLNGNWDIWISDLSDGKLTRLTSDLSEDVHPDWSPDGSQIVFNSDRDGLYEIYSMNVDGTNVSRLTHNQEAIVLFPRWSPNGSQIVFFTNSLEDPTQADIFVMSAYCNHSIRQLTTDVAIDRVATYSPDGQSIVFRSERDGDSDIYTMNLYTGRTQPVSFNSQMDMSPDW